MEMDAARAFCKYWDVDRPGELRYLNLKLIEEDLTSAPVKESPEGKKGNLLVLGPVFEWVPTDIVHVRNMYNMTFGNLEEEKAIEALKKAKELDEKWRDEANRALGDIGAKLVCIHDEEEQNLYAFREIEE